MFNKFKKIFLYTCLALCTNLTHASSLNDDGQQNVDFRQCSSDRVIKLLETEVNKSIEELRKNPGNHDPEAFKEQLITFLTAMQPKDSRIFVQFLRNQYFFYQVKIFEEFKQKLKQEQKKVQDQTIFNTTVDGQIKILITKLLKMGLDLGEPNLLESVLFLPECYGFSAGEGSHRWTEAGKRFDDLMREPDSDDNNYVNHHNNNNNNNNDEQAACAMSAPMRFQEKLLKNRVCFRFLQNVLKQGMIFELTYTTNGDPANEGPVNFYLENVYSKAIFSQQIQPTVTEKNSEKVFHLSCSIIFDADIIGFDVPNPQKASNDDQRMIGFALKTLKIS